MSREAPEERVAGFQVSAGDLEAKALARVKQGRRRAQRDHDVDLLAIVSRLQGAKCVLRLVGSAGSGIEFTKRQPLSPLGDAVAPVSVGPGAPARLHTGRVPGVTLGAAIWDS